GTAYLRDDGAELTRLERKMAIHAAVAAAQRQVLLYEAGAERHGNDRSGSTEGVVRQADQAARDRSQHGDRCEVQRVVRRWVAARAPQEDDIRSAGAPQHAYGMGDFLQ